MKTKIKGRYGSVYYFGYEEPFLFTEPQDDKENEEEPEPPAIEKSSENPEKKNKI